MSPEQARGLSEIDNRSDGYYGFLKRQDGSKLFFIGVDAMIKSDVINQGNTVNRIRFDCVGNTLILYVNGVFVHQIEAADFTHGDIGLLTDTFETSGVDILFDNVEVFELKP